MAQLTQEMKEMIATQQCFLATVSKEGVPNNAPKRSTRVFNDETLMFSEGTAGNTYKNILDGSKVSVAVVNREIVDGYRFLGTPEALTSGEIYDQAAQELDENKRKALYDEWQRIVADQLPLIYTVLNTDMYAVRNKFGNLKPTVNGGAFHNIEEIYVKK